MTESQGKPKARRTSQASQVRKKASKPKSLPMADAIANSAVDWRDELLAEVRRLIFEADPEMVEERKWIKSSNPAGIPVWSRSGIVCTGETYKQIVKLTFARGASLADPRGLFNAGLDGNVRRAIDIRQGETIDAKAFKALIQAAVAENLRMGARKPTTPINAMSAAKAGTSDKVVLLSGGNPQIAKGDGEAPVRAYIAAIPDWKRNVAQQLDALIVRTVPDVRKAVRWNSPFYGIDGQGWFLSYHCFTKYLKVVFLRGTSLRPLPPVESKDPNTRYFHIHEDDSLDERQLEGWIRQASELPGEPLF